jgi:hypothetical protein
MNVGASPLSRAGGAQVAEAMELVSSVGVAHVRGVLSGPVCEALVRATRSVQWRRAPSLVGVVRQDAEIAEFELRTAPRVVRALGTAFAGVVCPSLTALAGEQAREWPNDVATMRYLPGEGVTAHRDHRRYRLLVMICSTSGEGRLKIVEDRSALVVKEEFDLIPGDVTLMAAPGVGQPPMHVVATGGLGTRLSVTYRLDSQRLCAPVD